MLPFWIAVSGTDAVHAPPSGTPTEIVPLPHQHGLLVVLLGQGLSQQESCSVPSSGARL